MDPVSRTVRSLRAIPLWLWFVGVGAADVAIALIAAYGVHARFAILWILLPALPLFFDPSSPQGMALYLEGALLFGSAFAIWGTVGLIFGALLRWGWSPRE